MYIYIEKTMYLDLSKRPIIFFKITQYNSDPHNTRTLTPMNVRTQILPL